MDRIGCHRLLGGNGYQGRGQQGPADDKESVH
jgi:hypothetical protein